MPWVKILWKLSIKHRETATATFVQGGVRECFGPAPPTVVHLGVRLAEAHGHPVAAGVVRLQQLQQLLPGDVRRVRDGVGLADVDEDLLLVGLRDCLHAHAWGKGGGGGTRWSNRPILFSLFFFDLIFFETRRVQLLTGLWLDFFEVWVFSRHVSHRLRNTNRKLVETSQPPQNVKLLRCLLQGSPTRCPRPRAT